MATRAERMEEAIETVAGVEDLLWALALNDIGLRRAYFVEVTGFEDRTVVKALAKLANTGVLAPTDGLKFKLAEPELAALTRERIPAETASDLHLKSLDYADRVPGLSPTFRAVHLIGAERYREAGEYLLELLEKDEGSRRAKIVSLMRRTLAGLWLDATEDQGLVEHLGRSVLESGRGWMKPKVARSVARGLLECGISEAGTTWVQAFLDDLKRETRKKSKEAANAAENSHVLSEASPPSTPEEGSSGPVAPSG